MARVSIGQTELRKVIVLANSQRWKSVLLSNQLLKLSFKNFQTAWKNYVCTINNAQKWPELLRIKLFMLCPKLNQKHPSKLYASLSTLSTIALYHHYSVIDLSISSRPIFPSLPSFRNGLLWCKCVPSWSPPRAHHQLRYQILQALTLPQVLRYAALLVGVGYGLSHQASITAKINQAHIDADSQHKTNLIQRAKAEWAKKTAPKEDSGSEFSFFPVFAGGGSNGQEGGIGG